MEYISTDTSNLTANENFVDISTATTLKIVGIGVPFALIPGASIVMPILIKVAEKHKIDRIAHHEPIYFAVPHANV